MNINTTPSPIPGFDPASLHSTLKEVTKTAGESLTKALTLLSNVDATGVLPSKDGILQLAPPKMNLSAMDLTLRIGLLQDALNQLMTAVSKNEIEGRLNELNRENREQLDKMNEQMKEIEKEASKRREADKKVNIFQAIANFFKAIFDVISAVFTAIAAIGYALTGNVVAAAGLFAATAALMASGVINMVMAVDSVIKAAGGGGFLSDKAIAGMTKATEILGYVAMGAAMVGGLGAVVDGIRTGANMAAGKLAEHGIKMSTKEIMREVVKAGGDLFQDIASKGLDNVAKELAKEGLEQAGKKSLSTMAWELAEETAKKAADKGASHVLKDLAKETAMAAARATIKETLFASLEPVLRLAARQAITSAVIQGSMQITQGVGGVLVADIREDAAEARRKADEAEALAKAIQAMIELLRKTIEQLQEDLQVMMETSMETISAIFNAADETANSMKDLMHFQAA
ncbi:type III secretion system translocon subunit SctE [Prosthecobacter dejongeii]|uniref:Translocator protein BipB-like C-terminal domain-containing protein n=1 Tax=Prosthecobacter dejongeii TaxID=48465 RepID=A0A7W7YK54_9BACT|nr:type III secretion system translocon subunit SctE [Prosthecobacter dejongeii]MBB5037711.1 hypothetical protein [Prosthecobacter dejongeii]